ncbi:zf-TFIIB domain-containing protein [Microbulbifer sp.]|uniref:zf-TFIIB domain-containing protein n=1 Tax=Microbulbifer sp. TaxID=1908541 RepID=UPI003F3362D5
MRKCTSCNSGVLKPHFLDELFRAHICSACGGNWILIEDYVAWKEHNPQHTFPSDLDFAQVDVADSRKALLCPVSGAIMQKFRISSRSDRRVDYSPAVGGLWLDKGEWELLKSEGLAGSLNAVVTHQWQQKVRQESARGTFSEIYRQKFGEEVYEKIKDLRAWLQAQPQKADLRAYLLAEDPYSAEK